MTKDIGRENSTKGIDFENKYYQEFSGYPLETQCKVSKHAKHAAIDTRDYFRKKYTFSIVDIEQTNTTSKLQRFIRAKIEDPADIAFRTNTEEFFGISLKYGGDSVTIKQPGLKTLFEIFEGSTKVLKKALKDHAKDIENITKEEIDPEQSKSQKHKLFKKLIRDDSPLVGKARQRNMHYRCYLAKALGGAFNKLDLVKKKKALKNLFNLSDSDIIKTIVVHYNIKKEQTNIQDPHKYFRELSRDTVNIRCEVMGTLLKFLCSFNDGKEFHFISCQIKNRSCSPFTSILGNVRKGSRKNYQEV